MGKLNSSLLILIYNTDWRRLCFISLTLVVKRRPKFHVLQKSLHKAILHFWPTVPSSFVYLCKFMKQARVTMPVKPFHKMFFASDTADWTVLLEIKNSALLAPARSLDLQALLFFFASTNVKTITAKDVSGSSSSKGPSHTLSAATLTGIVFFQELKIKTMNPL